MDIWRAQLKVLWTYGGPHCRHHGHLEDPTGDTMDCWKAQLEIPWTTEGPTVNTVDTYRTSMETP